VTDPADLPGAFARAQELARLHRVPVVVEVVLERVTNIAMGQDLDAITEFEELATTREHAPTATIPLP
jgi:tartronate-semialdehyde synthase